MEHFGSQFREPSLNQVHPRGVGGCKMEVESGVFYEPGPYSIGFMRCIIVQDDVDFEFFWNFFFHLIQKGYELDRPMSLCGVGDHLARGNIKCCKEICCAVAFVVMCLPLWNKRSHGKQWLGSIQRLDLCLFVNT